jgi:pSer/pThr/pTyr-binding forkhead associated (FHA) protein
MFKLVIQDDEGKTTVVPLIRDEITIGRKEGNTIRLTERNVSRRHARILRNNGEVQIEDLNSYNGIRVNNARIAERVSLRVSDQVQIGDYKLYLKAEGVEQADEQQRTMPLERMDQGLPTEVMAAVGNGATAPMSPAVAPTLQQAPLIPPPAPIPGTPAPNRSPASVADTDPSGRPVATAAQVAALSATPGYGKLVVLSSNFAGKEFDLTRPQMIIGRTDENDIVINHRSISRNHAKITRDPETGRYTISDLQSSNGVRVNGQDYGKVELRKGDSVDLGQVRFRFVEPGEDFVFARDAVVTDIDEGGGKKGTVIAIALALVVLGGAGAFFALKKKDTGSSAAGNGSQVVNNGSGSNTIVAVGSNGSDQLATTNGSDTVPPTNGSGSDPDAKPDDEAGQLKIECNRFAMDKKWTDATKCADRLASLDADAAKELKASYKSELENELSKDKLNDAIRAKDYKKAKRELAAIEQDSVYRQEADEAFKKFQDDQTQLFADSALAAKRANKCSEIDRLIAQAKAMGNDDAVERVAEHKCTTANNAPDIKEKPDCSSRLVDNTSACKRQFCAKNPTDGHCSSQVAPPASCDADALKQKGMAAVGMGQHAAALAQFEASLRCKEDPFVHRLAFMSACQSGNSPKAKLHYRKIPPAQQANVAQICIRQKPPVDYQ